LKTQSSLREEQNTKISQEPFLHSVIIIHESGSERERKTFQNQVLK